MLPILLTTLTLALAKWHPPPDQHPPLTPLRSYLLHATPTRTGRQLLEESAELTGTFETLSRHDELASHPFIFATIACHDEMEAGITVLHEGLLRAQHRQPLVVLTAAGVSDGVRSRLARLPLVSVFKVATDGRSYCESREGGDCAHLKLLLFAFARVDKVVFLEYDTVVLGSLEELIAMPAFSAVREAHSGLVETAVMVVKPDVGVYAELKREFCGGDWSDHEVLRRVVPDEVWNEVDDAFHVPQEHMDSLWYRRMVMRPKVVHFKGGVKPWNWWRVGTGEAVSLEAFRLWCEVARGGGFECGEGGMERTLQMNGWSEKKRMTVLLSTMNRRNWVGLVRHYASFKFVATVVLVWHEPGGDPPLAAGLGLKVVVWQGGKDSLNNRFFAPGNLTECVYVCDDDIKVGEQQLLRGFQVWKGASRRLVGFFPRRWMVERPYYSAKVGGGYNVVLTKGLFTHRSFLFMYVHLLPRRVREVVDRWKNCEDLLFNMMVSGYMGVAPLHVLVEGSIVDMGHGGGISGRGGHFSTRFQCVQELIEEMGLTHAPLSIGSYSEKPLKNKERE